MSEEARPDIRQYSAAQLQSLMQEWGEKPFRGKQIYEWLWAKGARSFPAMSNLSKTLRDQLDAQFGIYPVTTMQEFQSKDGTVKLGFQLHDGHFVEGVLIPSKGRYTACISSQVGCSLSCKFCATGTIDLKRNIKAGEIYDQAYLINEACKRIYGAPLTNIVYMGMGEPLLNFKEVTNSIRLITSDQGMGLSPRRITVSTVGIAKMIKKLADEQLRINFALSLHVANEEKRQQVMPITLSNTIPDLKAAVQYFYEQTGVAVTYEYTLLRGFNDGLEDARELAAFCKATPCKINLIEYNPVETSEFGRAAEDRAEAFMAHLSGKGLTVSLRRSRGEDIDAACGQLANKHEPVSS